MLRRPGVRREGFRGLGDGGLGTEILSLGANRLYFHSALAAPGSPAIDAAWQFTSELLRRRASKATQVDALAEGSIIGPWTAGQKAIDRQYLYGPLKPGTISGTVKMQLKSREIAGTDNAQGIFGLRVVSNDFATVRGTLLAVAQYGSGTEFAAGAGLTNRIYANGDALTPVVNADGDWLVIEIGYTDTAGTTPEAATEWGSTSAIGDLPEDEVDSLAKRGWIEITVA